MLKQNAMLARWLILCLCLVVVMIIIGGLTRLTNSGLSIIEWQPIDGIIPPLKQADWLTEFSKYQTSLQYKQENFNMTLSEFKFIFGLEYIHRLAGRITGLLYIIPLLYFLVKKKINREDKPIYYLIAGLFFVQGFMGWYMVKSGLFGLPRVSHFRLAAHLIIAIIIYSLLFWQSMKNSFEGLPDSSQICLKNIKIICLIAICGLYCQIFLGALTAGLHAGLVYNSFPLMGKSFIPEEIMSGSITLHDFNNAVFVQFAHRVVAYILSGLVICFVIALFQLKHLKLSRAGLYTLFALFLQVVAGVLTLWYKVPIPLALLHQIGAIMLLSCLLWCYFLLKSA